MRLVGRLGMANRQMVVGKSRDSSIRDSRNVDVVFCIPSVVELER